MAKQFQIIRDSRFSQNKAELAAMVRDKIEKIAAALSELKDVVFVVERLYFTQSTDSDDIDCKAICYVAKNGNKVSWSDIYLAINTIYIPVYINVSNDHVLNLADAQYRDIQDLRNSLGTWYSGLAFKPLDDVDAFINKGLAEHAINRTLSGFESIQAVVKLNTLLKMSRAEMRSAATVGVDLLIAAN